MKKLLLTILLCCLAFAEVNGLKANTAREYVLEQQKTFVIELIKHCKNRLPVLRTTPEVRRKTTESLDELKNFLSTHPDALASAIDTFTTCIEHKCKDADVLIEDCIKNYNETYKNEMLPDTQEIQGKLSALITCYFNFQLTTLGAADHYVNTFLQKTQINTYLDLAKPWFALAAVYVTIHASLKMLDEQLKANEETISTNVKTKPSHDTLEIDTINTTRIISKNLQTALTTAKAVAASCIKELDSSTTKLIASYIITPGIKNSLAKMHRYASENFNAAYAQVINKQRKSGYTVKPSKESFATVSGYHDTKLLLTPLIDFCAHLTEYRAADLKISRGYLFEGDLANGRRLAHAIAGEITQTLQKSGSKTKWQVYETHGSALINKGLDKVIEECLEFGPTLLVINNIDWIYNQKDIEPEVYAHIIARLSKYLSQDSNAPLIICATSQNHSVIDPVMLECNKFELIKIN